MFLNKYSIYNDGLCGRVLTIQLSDIRFEIPSACEFTKVCMKLTNDGSRLNVPSRNRKLKWLPEGVQTLAVKKGQETELDK